MATTAQSKIRMFLWYATEAEEAARFYTSIFPDSRVDHVTGLQSESPSGPPGSVKVVDFTLFGQRFQAMSAGPHHDFNDAISIMITCDDQRLISSSKFIRVAAEIPWIGMVIQQNRLDFQAIDR